MSNNNQIDIPLWFGKGLEFTGKWISNNNKCKILDYSATSNVAQVEITSNGSTWTEDGWNLQHTIWGFNNGDYKRI